MSGRGWLSSRASSAALGALGGGWLLLAGSCAFIYDFENNYENEAGSNGGTASGSGGAMSTSSGPMSGGGGAGGALCTFSDDCAIEALSQEADGSYGDISIGGTLVFWIRDNGFSIRSKDIGNPDRKDRFNQLNVQHIAADLDDVLYYVISGDVLQYAMDTSQDVLLDTDPTALTVQVKHAYWPSSADKKIHKGIPMDTTSFNDLIGDSPYLISASEGADQVYWTYLGSDPTQSMGGVKRLDKGDVAINQDLPTGIAADGEDVYWITREGTLHKYSYTAMPPYKDTVEPPFADINITSGRVAVSNTHVYWLGPDTTSCVTPCVCGPECGAVLRILKDDFTKPVEIFANLNSSVLKGLAADDTHVYWTTGGSDSKLLRKAHNK